MGTLPANRPIHADRLSLFFTEYEGLRLATALVLTGVASRDRPDHSWAGFSNFKRRFGGSELNFVPSLDFIYDPIAYLEYHRAGR